jgi:hypothetical protein
MDVLKYKRVITSIIVVLTGAAAWKAATWDQSEHEQPTFTPIAEIVPTPERPVNQITLDTSSNQLSQLGLVAVDPRFDCISDHPTAASQEAC